MKSQWRAWRAKRSLLATGFGQRQIRVHRVRDASREFRPSKAEDELMRFVRFLKDHGGADAGALHFCESAVKGAAVIWVQANYDDAGIAETILRHGGAREIAVLKVDVAGWREDAAKDSWPPGRPLEEPANPRAMNLSRGSGRLRTSESGVGLEV
jgi:hypothetical protein